MSAVSPDLLKQLGHAIAQAGGRGILVGGCVRDALLGRTPKDYDIEIFGLSREQVTHVLSAFGLVKAFGASFAVLQVRGLDIDFTLPRATTFSEAARYRDLTINSMGRDLVTDELLDPHGGQKDLASRTLAAVDATTFADDALRGLRVAQLAARYDMTPNTELLRLCQGLDLSRIAGERLFIEWRKLLLLAPQPSRGLRILRDAHLLRFFPGLAALVGTEQNPKWHPEGDVWVHTAMVVDEAARLRRGDADDVPLMFGALLHDVGKPVSTRMIDGVMRSHGHDVSGVQVSIDFLTALRAPNDLIEAVSVLVRHHLAPAILGDSEAGDKAFRRLVRALYQAHVSPELLERLARADHLGRTTPDAQARRFAAGDRFAARITALNLRQPVPDVVLGRHLLARGYAPGAAMGALLQTCREVQDETGWTDANQILARVLD